MHNLLNERGKTEIDLTHEMIKRDEENMRDEEDRIRRSIASQDDEINLGDGDREDQEQFKTQAKAQKKKKHRQHVQGSLFPNNTVTQGSSFIPQVD